MKIGIMTFLDGTNYGGFFQAYSLYCFLVENKYDVEFINYKNKSHFFHEYRALLIKRNPFLVFKNISKIIKFKKEISGLPASKFTSSINKIKFNNYDIIIVGSDIVWNYQWYFLGKDPIYFGKNVNVKKLIAYAPSCGSINIDQIIPDFVIEGIKKFNFISVRDEKTALLVKKVTGYSPTIVLDPTFLYNTAGKECDIKKRTNYLLVYAFKLQPEEIKSAIKFAKINNLDLISIGYYNKWCDKNIINIGPFEWLGYIKNAKYIITSTFHGTIFSMKYRKKFATSNNDAIDSKIKTLLNSIGLENRIANGVELTKILKMDIDYYKVEDKLNSLIDESKQFLIGAIND